MSQNISSYNPIQYQQLQQLQQAQTQQTQNFAATPSAASNISDKGVVQNNPLLNAATSTPDNPLYFVGAAGISSAALMAINNVINNPLQTKQYDDTFFKKVETFVDKYASKPKAKNVIDKINDFGNSVKNTANKSEILRTLLNKPGLGGSQVQSQAAGAKGHLANRAIETMKKYKEHYLKTTGNEFKEFDAILNKASKESYKHYDDIMNAIRNSSADLKTVMGKRPWWGLGLVKNKVSLQEILNKDILIKNYKTAGTSLGQKAAGYLMRSIECLTNGMFSGKGQVLIQALMIAQSVNEASKAEKGEKFSTFMASFAELMAFLATMGIQMRIVNHLAGLKHIGMSKDNVNKLHDAIAKANQAAKAGNHSEYAKQLNIIDKLKDVSKKTATSGNTSIKWYQKPVKWIGKLMSFGRVKETIKPLKTTKFATNLAKIPYGLKVGLGYAGRVAFIMAAIIPVFSGIAKKVSYTIFGKPTKTLEKQKQMEEAEKNSADNIQNGQPLEPLQQPSQVVQQPSAAPQVQNIQQPQQQPGSLYQQFTNQYHNPAGAQSMSPQTPAAASVRTPEQNAGIVRTYIPSPILGVENTIAPPMSHTAAIDAVLRQADLAEAQAQKYL